MTAIVYPESLFTSLRLQLMLMRFEIQDVEKQRHGLNRRTWLTSFPTCAHWTIV